MNILGISGSTRTPELSGTYRLVETVLDATGCKYELISLKDKTIKGCTACLGCVKDNVCVLKDDMAQMREKIAQADAYVIGAPNYYSGLNALTHALLERLYQFRHRDGNTLWGKLAIAVGVGGTSGSFSCDEIEKFMDYNFIETLAKVAGQGVACCYSCGYGETCNIGLPAMLHGPGVKVNNDMIPDISKQEFVLDAAKQAGKLLGTRLKKGYDRVGVTQKMQQTMMARFKESS